MTMKQTERYARVNITLPRETLSLIERVAKKSNRSAFLDCAIRFYVAEAGRNNLKKRLREGAKVRYERDRDIAAEWFRVESDS